MYKLLRLVTKPVLLGIHWAMSMVHMVNCHGWPWAIKSPVAYPMKFTQTADWVCVEFKDAATTATFCWLTGKPSTWKLDPASWQIVDVTNQTQLSSWTITELPNQM